MAFTALFIWAIETAFFGFNDMPETGLEKFLDVISFVLLVWGVIGDITTNQKVVVSKENEI